VTKSKAQADARAAFEAGQRQALQAQAMRPALGPSVILNGPVERSLVQWHPGLTLAQALVDAGYNGPGEPTALYVVRQGRAFQVDPQQLLRGDDVPLEAGDVIEIRTGPINPAMR
jgi:hypothetical protein